MDRYYGSSQALETLLKPATTPVPIQFRRELPQDAPRPPVPLASTALSGLFQSIFGETGAP